MPVIRITTASVHARRFAEAQAAEYGVSVAECMSDIADPFDGWRADLDAAMRALQPGDTFQCADLSRLSADEWRAFRQSFRLCAPYGLNFADALPRMADGALYVHPSCRADAK